MAFGHLVARQRAAQQKRALQARYWRRVAELEAISAAAKRAPAPLTRARSVYVPPRGGVAFALLGRIVSR
jgi:hypothetical protein